VTPRPARLLTQNSELRAEGIYNWTLPAWAGRLPDGRTYNTCPSAGVCHRACYALNGTYRFPGVIARHQANLAYVLDDLYGWQAHMTYEIQHHCAGRWVRIHDAGDFFSDAYLMAWLDIAADCPKTGMYAYTKEVDRFRRLAEGRAPANLLWVYSYGGTQDRLLDPGRDRVADVFPDAETMTAAGYTSQDASDLLAVLGPSRVGIPANNIPGFRKRQAGRSFSQWQAQADATRPHRP
jgi:hypothetical protein